MVVRPPQSFGDRGEQARSASLGCIGVGVLELSQGEHAHAAAVGKFLPINLLLNKLKGLVRPLLNRVLRAALNLLPASVRPVAQVLAKKLGLGEAELLASDQKSSCPDRFIARCTRPRPPL